MASEDTGGSDYTGSEADFEDLTAMLSLDDENDEELAAAMAEVASPTKQQHEGDEGNDEDDDGDNLINSLMDAINETELGDEGLTSESSDVVEFDHSKNDATENGDDKGKQSSLKAELNENKTSATLPSSSTSETEGGAATEKKDKDEKVPMQQFMNAMSIIQELEGRIAVLENERDLLIQQNQQQQTMIEKYDDENGQQKKMIEHYETQLQSFPQMMEDWMATNEQIVTRNAAESAKSEYWDQHMRKEEAKFAKEQEQLRTDNLKQSDFLKSLVTNTKNPLEGLQNQPIWKRLGNSMSNLGKGVKTQQHPWASPISSNGGGKNLVSSSPLASTATLIPNLDDDEDDTQPNVVEPSPKDLKKKRDCDDKEVLNLIT